MTPATVKAPDLVVEAGPLQRCFGGDVRMGVETDGEVIVRATPLLGFAHRGIEKLAESGGYARVLPLLACADRAAIVHTAAAFSMAIEALAEVRVPPKASWLRGAAMEIERAASHLGWLAAWTSDAGLERVAGLARREARAAGEALTLVTGLTAGRGYVMPGGVSVEPSAEDIAAADALLADTEARLDALASELDRGGLFARFARGVGSVGRETCEETGATGPCLRAAGVARDTRRYLPYQPYPKAELALPLGSAGDCWDRCFVRLEEVTWSLRVARALLAGMPSGDHAVEVPADLVPPAGEAFAAVESPRGELGVHVVSDGSGKPYRLRLRSPSFYLLGAAVAALEGAPLDAASFILGSFDLAAAEVDR